MGSVYDDEDQISVILHAVGEYFEVKKKMTVVKDFTFSHPIITLFCIVLATMSSIPVICFITFVAGSIFLTVTGFVLIEGTMLTIAIILLGGSILFIGLFAVVFSSIIVAAFFAFDFSFHIINNLTERLLSDKKQLEIKNKLK